MEWHGLSGLTLTRFTAFDHAHLEFSPGLNVLVGPNGTGKTHVLKLIYSSLTAGRERKSVASKLLAVFLPHEQRLGRLVRRRRGSSEAEILFDRGNERLKLVFSNHTLSDARETGTRKWNAAVAGTEALYIPSRDILANSPGFRSLYAAREIHFEEVYADLLDRALRPPLRGKPDAPRAELLDVLNRTMRGRVETEDEVFFLRSRQGKVEFSLLAEGFRKLGVLSVLIQNGVLSQGSVLCWDEPEANLGVAAMHMIADFVLTLSRHGTQVFLATHDYVLLSALEALRIPEDGVCFTLLMPGDKDGPVCATKFDRVADITPNVMTQVHSEMLARQVDEAMRR